MVLSAGRPILPAKPSCSCCCCGGGVGVGAGGGSCFWRSNLKEQRRSSMALVPVFGSSKIKVYSGMCRCLVANVGTPATVSATHNCFSRSQSCAEPWNYALGFEKGVWQNGKQQRHGRRYEFLFREGSHSGGSFKHRNGSAWHLMGAGTFPSFSFWRPEAGLRMSELMNSTERTIHCALSKQLGLAGNEAHGHLDTTTVNDAEVAIRTSWGKKGWGRRKRQGQMPKASGTSAGSTAKKDKKVVVVVESPAKARAIETFLGENYVVLASYGHVRDLAARSGSVRPQEEFAMLWEVPSTAQAHINSIKAALKGYYTEL